MSTDTPAPEEPSRADLAARVEELEAELTDVTAELSELRTEAANAAQAAAEATETAAEASEAAADAAENSEQMVIVATQGTLDMAYPPLILASTAAAFGYDVTVFHTFWGLEVLHEEHAGELELSAVGNPNLSVPNAVAALPGMDAVTTRMMRRKIEANEVASIEELIRTSLDTGVDLQACQMTMDLFGYEEDDFFDGVTTGVGAATAFQKMTDADVQLLV
jgi:peroxiredoxin family protein